MATWRDWSYGNEPEDILPSSQAILCQKTITITILSQLSTGQLIVIHFLFQNSPYMAYSTTWKRNFFGKPPESKNPYEETHSGPDFYEIFRDGTDNWGKVKEIHTA